MARLFRREYAADCVASACVLSYCGWMCLREAGTPTGALVGELAFSAVGLAVGWVFVRNASLTELDRRTRLGWGILALSALALLTTGVTWPHFVGAPVASADPEWAGVLDAVQRVLLLGAFLAFPGRALAVRGRTRLAADMGMILVAGFVLAYDFGARASARFSSLGSPELALAQTVLDWAVLATAAIGVVHKRDSVTRTAFLWILAAYTLDLTANYLLSRRPAYLLGDGIDGLWFAAWVCRWVAARSAWHGYARARATGVRVPETSVTDLRSGVFSYGLAAATFALLVGRVTIGEREHLALFALSATAMAGLLLLRQVVELRENRRLFAGRLAQEARFRSLVQKASDVVLVVDGSGQVSYVGASADRILGSGAIPAGSRLSDLVPEDEAGRLAPLFREPTDDPGPIQTRMRAASGEWRAVEVVATDMRADPAVAGIVLNCRDVTERNEIERQLHHAQHLDAVGHLAGGLAHDFNNVLTAIQGYTDLLRDDLPSSPESASDLRHIEDAVDRAAAVTRKLLAFSRKETVGRTVLDLNVVLRDLGPLLRQLLTDRIEVETAYDCGLWRLEADAGQLEQVVINLVTNSRDAMPNGGRVSIATANHTITRPAPDTGHLPAGDYVALVVIDQGTGMPDEVRERIFDPFYSTKPRDRGIGLGLAMVHRIVANCAGHVAVESVLGRGTTVRVFLPRAGEGREP